MGEECVIERDAGCCEVLGGPVQIDGIPIGYRRDQQVQTRCPIYLVLNRPVREPTLAVGIDGGGEGMACFSLVEAGLAGPAQVGLLKPVEREQRPLNAAEFGQREIQPVLAFVGGQLA